jgi:hypothetical protein
MNLHQRQTHPEYIEGCFGCKVTTLELGVGDSNSKVEMSTSKWDAELNAYRNARAQGIQPTGTSMAKVQEAVRISDKVGKAFDGNTGTFK